MRGGTILAVVLSLAGGLPTGGARAAELDQIQALADRGRTEEALRQVEGHLVGQPDQLDGQLLRGTLLADLGRSQDAERAFLLLSRQYPDRPEPIHNLAVMRARAGRPAMATRALEGLVARYPTYETAVSNLERIRQQAASGQYDPLESDRRRMQLALTPRLRFPATVALVADATPAPPATPPASPPPPVQRPGRRGQPNPEDPVVAARDLPLADLVPIGRAPAPVPAALPPVEAPAVEPAPQLRPPETAAAQAPTTAATEVPNEVATATPPASDIAEPVQETAATPASVAAAADSLRDELAAVVIAWAGAWSEQRVKEYLGFYASGFQPVGYPSRDTWETVRRQRVATPSFIEVTIDLDSLEIRRTGPDEASATFVQSYRSDRFGDTVRKTLGLAREEGEWRILSEVSQ